MNEKGTKLENPTRKELKEYKVKEWPITQKEKETIVRVDKDTNTIDYFSQVGSHIRPLIKNENSEIIITQATLDSEEKYIRQISAKLPVTCMTISLKKSPKKTGTLGKLVSG